MSAYKVARGPAGEPTWWVGYEMAGADLSQYSNIRDATSEEVALMEKVVWENDSDSDRRKLRELIGRAALQASDGGE